MYAHQTTRVVQAAPLFGPDKATCILTLMSRTGILVGLKKWEQIATDDFFNYCCGMADCDNKIK